MSQIENLLVFQQGMSQQVKLADFENASAFGDIRDDRVTPYICPPEVAAAICKGDTTRLVVSGAEDIWAVGVMVLRLFGLRDPFSAASGLESSTPALAAISQLSQSDVAAVLHEAGVVQNSELESFLIGSRGSPGCLAVLPESRATVSQLLAKGWISGGHHTQFNRQGAEAMRAISSRVDAMQEDINDLGAKLQHSLERKLEEARERFERKVAQAMLQKQRQVEEMLAESESTDDKAQVYASELEQLRVSQMEERTALASKLEAMRRQFDDLQKEKLDGLLEAKQSVAEHAKGMLNEFTKEDGDAAARVQAMQKEEHTKLRARLEARQKKQVQCLMEQIERI